LDERFDSKILPLFRRHTRQVDQLLPELYLHGLSMGDFDLALRGLLGEGAPLSPSSLARLKEKWQLEYKRWKQRSLAAHDVVYMWVDGVYVKAGLEKQKAALLVVIGALRNGKKVVLAVENGYRESSESWAEVLRDLKRRGLKAPRLVIGDGHLGIWGALTEIYPQAEEQRCWNHRIRNILSRVPQKQQVEAKRQLHELAYAENRKTAEKLKTEFQQWCQQQGFPKAGELLDQDWERMVTFFSFPAAHWTHLRTTNVIETPFAGVRLRTDAAKRFKKVENATAVIWKTLMLAEQAFRVLKKADLLAFVADGVTYMDGIPVWERRTAA
jgi:transposase-like protein